jgi:hypothetical protein
MAAMGSTATAAAVTSVDGRSAAIRPMPLAVKATDE